MNEAWKKKTLIIGTLIGAFAGAASAYLLIKRSDDEETQPKLTPGEGVQVGLGVLGLLKLIASLGTD